jgi:hypothetical protein
MAEYWTSFQFLATLAVARHRVVHRPHALPDEPLRSRAAVLHGYGQPWSFEQFELEQPRTGEVLVQAGERLASRAVYQATLRNRQLY